MKQSTQLSFNCLKKVTCFDLLGHHLANTCNIRQKEKYKNELLVGIEISILQTNIHVCIMYG